MYFYSPTDRWFCILMCRLRGNGLSSVHVFNIQVLVLLVGWVSPVFLDFLLPTVLWLWLLNISWHCFYTSAPLCSVCCVCFVLLGVCPCPTHLLTSTFPNRSWRPELFLLILSLMLCSLQTCVVMCYCHISPSICSPSSSPVLGVSLLRGVFVSSGGWSTSVQQPCRASICCI